jgi:signal transduction histidine kinase
LTSQEVDLKELAEDVIEIAIQRSHDEEKAMNFELDLADNLSSVYADPDRIKQIIANLVENAYHYTPENGRVILAISDLNGKDIVQIDVHDNGVGIAPEDQSQVFERFYRGEDPLVLATPGTGLGLPIVRQLVEMHKGEIWVKSPGEHGEGSTFSFTLPVYKKSE